MRNSLGSAGSLRQLQRRYGTFERGKWQVLRRQFYSFVEYPAAGQAQFLFFGNTLSTSGFNRQLTNIPKPNSFGTNHFLVKGLAMDYFIADHGLASYASTDVTTLAADMLYGFANGGFLEMKIGARTVLEIPMPFYQCPPANGGSRATSIGVAAGVTPPPLVDFQRREESKFLTEPEILIEAEQQFEISLSYPSGLLPILATTVHNAATNKLFVGVTLDGLLYRPVQ